MGWAFVIAPCYGCGQPFTFNADHVPSVLVDGVREPFCRACIARANPERERRGLAPIVPHPDAYEPGEI